MKDTAFKNIFDRINKHKAEILCFVLFGLYFIYYAKHRLGSSDEFYYMINSFRLFSGDRYVADNWDIAQFSTFTQFPFFLIFRIFHPNDNEGIILFFRYEYLISSFICAYLLYKTTNKNRFMFVLCFAFAVFVPLNMPTLSYNTMPVLCLVLSYYAYVNIRNRPVSLMVAGIFFALIVLNTPFFVFFYPVLFIYALIKKDLKSFLYLSSGCLIVFCIFAVSIMCGQNINYLIDNLKCFTLETHKLAGDAISYVIYKTQRLFALYPFEFISSIAVMMLCLYGVKTSKRNVVYISLVSAAVIGLIMMFIHPNYLNFGGNGFSFVPIGALGLITALNRKTREEYKALYFFSLALSFTIYSESNALVTFQSPLILTVIDTVWMFNDMYKLEENSRLIGVSIQLCILLFAVYPTFETLAVRGSLIERGALKGLYVNDIQRDDYYKKLDLIKTIKDNGNAKVNVISRNNIILYFDLNKTIDTADVYLDFYFKESYLDALNNFYNLHEDDKERIIILFKNELDVTEDDLKKLDSDYKLYNFLSYYYKTDQYPSVESFLKIIFMVSISIWISRSRL